MINARGFLLLLIVLTVLVALSQYLGAQGGKPPYCVGPSSALQFGTQNWICATVGGAQGPPGPPGPATPAQPAALSPLGGTPPCNVANWNGTAWSCVQTNYVTAN